MSSLLPKTNSSSKVAGGGGANCIKIKVMGSQHFKYRMKSYEALNVIAQPKVVEKCSPQNRTSHLKVQNGGSQSNVYSIF
jgi:hypothetical protein